MKNIKIVAFMFFAAVVLLAIAYALIVGDTAKIYVSGTVEVAPALREKSHAARTIFIILRAAAGASGDLPRQPPWGAYRDRVDFSSSDSYSFTLTKDNLQLMGQQTNPPASFDIKVRLDRDGQGGADQPGDLVGTLQQVASGSRAVHITLDSEIK